MAAIPPGPCGGARSSFRVSPGGGPFPGGPGPMAVAGRVLSPVVGGCLWAAASLTAAVRRAATI
eukprot:3591377-Heterocapsa_arctica.AAC.1